METEAAPRSRCSATKATSCWCISARISTALNQVELALPKLKLWDYLEQTTSYLSVVELGLYESWGRSTALWPIAASRPSPEWNAEIEETLARQRSRHASAPLSRNAAA